MSEREQALGHEIQSGGRASPWPDPNAPRSEVDVFKHEKREAARQAWAKSPTPNCPLCGVRLTQGYGFAAGGLGSYLICTDDCDFIVTIGSRDPCSDCGHQHAGKNLAGICVGCPCPHKGGKDAVVHGIVRSSRGDIATQWAADVETSR